MFYLSIGILGMYKFDYKMPFLPKRGQIWRACAIFSCVRVSLYLDTKKRRFKAFSGRLYIASILIV
jgi:hypothetical protein